MTTPATLPNLAPAFAVAEQIHALVDADTGALAKPKYNYLRLEAVGGGIWVATFDTVHDGDWYEKFSIKQYPHSARSTDPAAAIMEAARKLVEDLELSISL